MERLDGRSELESSLLASCEVGEGVGVMIHGSGDVDGCAVEGGAGIHGVVGVGGGVVFRNAVGMGGGVEFHNAVGVEVGVNDKTVEAGV